MSPTSRVFRQIVLALAVVALLAATQHAAADSILLVAGVDGNGNIGAFNPSTGASEGIFSNTFARGIATASNGNVLTASNNVIGQINPNGTTLSPFFTYSNANDIVLKLAVDTAGDVYALTQLDSGTEVDKFSPTGTFLGTLIPATNYDFDIQVAANGDVIADNYNDIITYNSSGQQIGRTFFPGGGSFDLTILGNNVFASIGGTEYGNGQLAGAVYECTGCVNGTGTMSLVGQDPNHGNLQELIPGPGGEILVADRDRNVVDAFDSNGNYIGVFATTYNFQTGQGTFGPYSMTYIGGGPAESGGPTTPEPMTLATFGVGLLAVARRLRKRAA